MQYGLDSLSVVVMAGGSGTRFWPLSRQAHPKQLLPLIENQSLLAQTFARVSGLVAPANNWMVVGQGHAVGCREIVPHIDATQVLVEPCPRNTAPAIGLAAIHLLSVNEEAMMAVLPADHYVKDATSFCEALSRARDVAASGTICTLGICPTRPETGYGYIQRGQPHRDVPGAYGVARFREKPALATARKYLDEGGFDWNAGVFVMRCDVYLKELARQLPALYGGLERLQPAIGTERYDDVLLDVYESLSSVSVDYGVMEGAESVAVVPVSCGWSDVGSFSALDAVLDADCDGNRVAGRAVTLDSSECTLYATGEHVIAAVGISDMTVVHTTDATLVMPTERAQDIRKVVETLKERQWNEYL